MRFPVLKLTSILLLFTFTLISCDTDNDPYRPDYSTVPEPFDYSGAEAVEVEEGVEAYILDEGTGNYSVDLRDDITVFITLRADGDIIYSSSMDHRVNPDNIRVSNIQHVSQLNPQILLNPRAVERSYSEGLKEGLLGMKEGERRTLIVSPEKGFQGVSDNHTLGNYRDATLQYDIVLSRISY